MSYYGKIIFSDDTTKEYSKKCIRFFDKAINAQPAYNS